MITNPRLLNKLNDKYLKKSRRSYKESLAIFEALWREAVSLGKLPLKNPMENLEKNIRIARALNSPQLLKKHYPKKRSKN